VRELRICVAMEGRLPESYWPLAEMMARSVRKHMPQAILVQHTDMAYPRLPWADEIVRFHMLGDLVDNRWSQMVKQTQETPDSYLLQLDCDVVMKSDVSDVFALDFDVAMCRTPDRADRVYNAGVIFCKPSGAGFWTEVLREYKDDTIRDGWEGSQTAITRAADKKKFKVLDLPFDTYNYTPSAPLGVPSSARLVHYRGQRKRFMAKDNPDLLETACLLS